MVKMKWPNLRKVYTDWISGGSLLRMAKYYNLSVENMYKAISLSQFIYEK